MKPMHGNRRQTLLFSDFRCIGRFTYLFKPKRCVAKKTHFFEKGGSTVTPPEGVMGDTSKNKINELVW